MWAICASCESTCGLQVFSVSAIDDTGKAQRKRAALCSWLTSLHSWLLEAYIELPGVEKAAVAVVVQSEGVDSSALVRGVFGRGDFLAPAISKQTLPVGQLLTSVRRYHRLPDYQRHRLSEDGSFPFVHITRRYFVERMSSWYFANRPHPDV